MQKNTILWADDDADDLLMMREILMKNGQHFELVEVRNGREALDYLNKARIKGKLPCLVILDINMPILDGKKTLSIIKEDKELKALPVVMFTTSNSELDRMYCQKLNTRMITKPPDFQTLQSTVLEMLQFCAS